MKKVDLLHISVLIISLLIGYEAVQTVFRLLTGLFYMPYDFQGNSLDLLTQNGLQLALYIGGTLILIRNARKIAAAILKDDPEGSWEDAPKWDLDRRNILLALFVGIGLYTLIQVIPSTLVGIYQTFEQKVSHDNSVRPGNQMDRLPSTC